jgi:phosphatidylserine/phosphatidylglycerophosphate/cardiolipin synthase-like enzyme
VFEVRELLCAAIDAADELIYLENQYFTSKDVLLAFKKRLEAPHRSKLKILMVMPQGADSPKEDFALGNRQRAVRHAVAKLAEHHGHSMRLLKSIQTSPEGPVATFIHAKLMIVDDSFLTCGSANLTNRSMHVDFELNASFQADDSDAGELLRTDIRCIRASLLAEHAGSTDAEPFESLETLIAVVDEACAAPASRLRSQAVEEADETDPLLVALFDPNGPTTLETLEDPLKDALSIEDTLVKNTWRRLGQRLGVFDIEQ